MLAEADGNRTHQAQILDLTGFEDLGRPFLLIFFGRG